MKGLMETIGGREERAEKTELQEGNEGISISRENGFFS